MFAVQRVVSLAVFLMRAHAYPSFRDTCPNCRNVPNCDGVLVNGVGHLNEAGGGPRNQFGIDFHEQYTGVWDEIICRMDSDGDGRTNGEELGDPNCVWTSGDTPEITEGITHPGLACPAPAPTTTPAPAPSCCKWSSSCGGSCASGWCSSSEGNCQGCGGSWCAPTVLTAVKAREAPTTAAGVFKCSVCGYEYDPADHNGAAFEDLPDDWKCPICGSPKSAFVQQGGRRVEHVKLHEAATTSAGVFKCSVCGYEYNPADHNGAAFEDLPDDWKCPICGSPKSAFVLQGGRLVEQVKLHEAATTSAGVFKCSVCGYEYDPADHNGAAFEDLPDDWKCPICGSPKSAFDQQGGR